MQNRINSTPLMLIARIIELQGEVLLKRESWSNYVPTAVGTELYAGDLLVPGLDVVVRVQCANGGSIWRLPEGEISSPTTYCPQLVRTIARPSGTILAPRGDSNGCEGSLSSSLREQAAMTSSICKGTRSRLDELAWQALPIATQKLAILYLCLDSATNEDAIAHLEAFLEADRCEIAAIYRLLGAYYAAIGSLVPAKAYYWQGMEIAVARDDIEGVAIAATELASICEVLGDGEAAAYYLSRGLDEYRRLGDSRQVSELEELLEL